MTSLCCNGVQADKLGEARREEAAEAAARAAEAAMARRDLARRLRAARAADRAAAQVKQVKQSMAAPDWELDDHEWCTPPCALHVVVGAGSASLLLATLP